MQTKNHHDIVRLLLVLFFGFSFASVLSARDFDRSVILHAIHTLENPHNVSRPGPRGELGPYQFRESTWRSYTNEPFLRALDRSVSDRVAVSHYEWLRGQFERAGLPASTYNIALAWNGGINSVLNGRAPKSAHNYAQRAVNLASVFGSSGDISVADTR